MEQNLRKVSIIIPSAPNRSTHDILSNLHEIRPPNLEFEIFIIKGTWPPSQRNLGIKNATSEFIFFFDDDVIIPKGSIEKALQVFQKNPEIMALGGPNLTPTKNSFMQHCFGHAHASFFTGLHTVSRYRTLKKLKKVTENNLATCNLAFRANILKKNYFNPYFYANEENELLGRILAEGHVLGYCPDFFVYHHRRKNLSGYLRQIFKWGEGRTIHTLYRPAHFKVTFFIPLLFFFYLASFIWIHPLWYLIPLLLYAILDVGFTIFTFWKEKKPSLLIIMLWLFPITHITYAMGTVYGFFTFFKKKKLPREQDFQIIKIEIT